MSPTFFAEHPTLRAGQRVIARVRARGWLDLPPWIGEFEQFKPAASWAVLIASIAFWMICRPYDGIRHDGMFYTGQTMLHLGQENLRADIFFSHGSQDQYSIFSSLYSVLVRVFDWSLASFVSVALMQAVFVASVLLLLCEFAPLPLAAFGLLMCGLHPYYGPFEIFSVGEPFTTARMFAEPVLVLAVWASLRKRVVLSALLLVGAALMHPLLAAPVAVLVAAQAYLDFPAWRSRMHLALVILVVVGVAVAIAKADVIFASLDDVWWNAMMEHTAQISPVNWDFEGWTVIASDVGLLVLLARETKGRQGKFLEIVALTVAVCFLISCWTASIFRWQLFTEAQLWRAEDIGHILALGLFPFLIWKKRDDGLLTLLGGLFLLIAMEYPRGPTAMCSTLGGLVCLGIGQRMPPATVSFRWLIGGACLFVFVGGTLNHLDKVSYEARDAVEFGLSYSAHWVFDSVFLALIGLSGLIAVVWQWPRIGLACAAILLVGAASAWDHRTPFQRYLEHSLSEPPALDKLIPPTATVLWSDDLRLPWFILRRPSYLSRNQSAGLVFNHATAMDFVDRTKAVEDFESEIASCKEMADVVGSCTLDEDVLRDICAPDAKGPDFVIVNHPLSNKLSPDFRWVIPGFGKAREEWGVYSCSSVVRRVPVAAQQPKAATGPHG